MKYYYKAVNKNENVIEGDIDVKDIKSALAYMSMHELKPIILKPINKKKNQIFNIFKKQITLEDKVFIIKYLALMLKVGTNLFKAIDILIQDFDKPSVVSFLREIKEDIENGKPFYSAFAKYPKSFSPVFVNLIKSGEVSGKLEDVFNKLSSSLENEHELRQKIKSALTYPIILLIASTLVLILLVSFSIPKIAKVFLSGGMNPPAFSKAVFTVGLFIGAHLTIILILLIVVSVGSVLFFTKTILGRKMLYNIALKIPVIKKIIKQISIQRFASTLSSLLSSGLSITEALEITAGSIGMPELKEALIRISKEGIQKGLTVGEAFKKEEVFPKVVSNLISISEKSGSLEQILQTLSDFYANEIGTSVKSLVSFIEPIMLLFIGLIIGTIALAVIIPVYQLSSSF